MILISSSWNLPIFMRDVFNLVLCYVMLPYFLRKISGYVENLWAKSYDLLCSLLCSLMLAYDFFMKVSKILCPVMLCLWWHDMLCWYSIICVQNLRIPYEIDYVHAENNELGAFREVEILVDVRGGPPFCFQIAFKSVAK